MNCRRTRRRSALLAEIPGGEKAQKMVMDALEGKGPAGGIVAKVLGMIGMGPKPGAVAPAASGGGGGGEEEGGKKKKKKKKGGDEDAGGGDDGGGGGDEGGEGKKKKKKKKKDAE